MDVLYVSSFPPQRCGLASYTWNLARSLIRADPDAHPSVLSFNFGGTYPSRHTYNGVGVYRILRKGYRSSYNSAAHFVNSSDIDIVHIQHEFGLFGGVHGSSILPFVERLRKPLVATFHSMKKASTNIRLTVERIAERADRIIVHSDIAANLLTSHYDIVEEKVQVIPHGVPCVNLSQFDRMDLRKRFGLKDRLVISNFGLMSTRKGLEYAIQAVKGLVEELPETLLLIIGATHPNILKRENERYRESLKNLAASLKMGENIRFINRFLDEQELVKYLIASDIYVIPYPYRDQISSGTLSYALSCGKAIISTSFQHAVELLGGFKTLSRGKAKFGRIIIGERGILVPPRDSESITEAIHILAEDKNLKSTLEANGYSYTVKRMAWPKVAGDHLKLYKLSLPRQQSDKESGLTKPIPMHVSAAYSGS